MVIAKQSQTGNCMGLIRHDSHARNEDQHVLQSEVEPPELMVLHMLKYHVIHCKPPLLD